MKKAICLNCDNEFEYGSSSTGKYCSCLCSSEHRKKQWFIKNRPLFEQGKLKSRFAYKKFVIKRDGEKCSLCDQGPEHNGEKLVMVIDHIDGDASNNMPGNFRLCCPNCDSQLPTFKARNLGNGRATKGMKWYSQL